MKSGAKRRRLRSINRHDAGINDYNEAIRLAPNFALAYNNRGDAYQAKGDFDQAFTDYGEAIRLDSKNSDSYFGCGRANLYAGRLPSALVDLTKANELSADDTYVALYLDIVSKRSKVSSRLAENAKQIDMTKWPAPVVRLYLGQSTPEATLVAADDPDATKKRGQVCEASFYIGQLALQRGDKDEGVRLFRLAVGGCPKDFTEWASANAELKALGAN